MPTTPSKRLLYSLAIVLAWFGFVIEGSHALFSSAANLTGNSIATGTAALLVSNSQAGSSTTFAESRPGFSVNLNPGESDVHYFILKNTGSSGVPMDIGVSASVATPTAPIAPLIALEFTPVDSAGLAQGTPVHTSLDEMVNPIRLTGTVAANSTQRYMVKVTLDQSYTNQSETVGYDLAFTGIQHYAP